jgi:xylose dehydrogenase (NAD/NADP)
LHAEWTILAAKSGKHVLCEKPLALNTDQVDAMADAAAANGIVFMEALMYRLHPQTERVVEMVQAGELGNIQLITASLNFQVPHPDDIRLAKSLGGGALLDVGSYCTSVARMVTQAEPNRIQGWARMSSNGEVDESFAGVLGSPRGELATFSCTMRGTHEAWYRITGSEGTLVVPKPYASGTDDRVLQVYRGKGTEERIVVPGADHYQLMVNRFAECVFDGATPPVSLADSRANVQVLDALKTSAMKHNGAYC